MIGRERNVELVNADLRKHRKLHRFSGRTPQVPVRKSACWFWSNNLLTAIWRYPAESKQNRRHVTRENRRVKAGRSPRRPAAPKSDAHGSIWVVLADDPNPGDFVGDT